MSAHEQCLVASNGPSPAVEVIQGYAAQFELIGSGTVAIDLDMHDDSF